MGQIIPGKGDFRREWRQGGAATNPARQGASAPSDTKPGPKQPAWRTPKAQRKGDSLLRWLLVGAAGGLLLGLGAAELSLLSQDGEARKQERSLDEKVPASRSTAPEATVAATLIGPLPAMTLSPGDKAVLEVRLDRHGYRGPIRVQLEDLPEKVTAPTVTLTGEQALAQLEVTAATDAARAERTATVAARGDGWKDDQRLPLMVRVQLADTFINSFAMKLKLLPADRFLMGSPEEDTNGSSEEKPRHEVTLTQPFYMGVYLVTQEEYQKVTRKGNPSFFATGHEGANKVAGLDTARFPVEDVSWTDAKAFCAALNEKDTKKPAGWEYDLPTEAEWEYACRAGTQTIYFFADDPANLKDYAWYNGNADLRTHEVGTRKANPWGLYDMHGNVWQWCADWYAKDYYQGKGPLTDPKGPTSGTNRVLRGGSWYFDARACRAASRMSGAPDFHELSVGFRVVLRPSVRTP